jgi:RNA polymerase sigma factor (sigma-70 family)
MVEVVGRWQGGRVAAQEHGASTLRVADAEFAASGDGNLTLVAMTPQAADPTGFDERYVELFVRAQRCALRVLGHRDVAEDVAAETMARAFARWSKINAYAPAWVTRVAINLATDMLRRKPALVVGRAERTDESVDRLLLRQQLARLPRRQRDAIVIRYLLGFDEKETATLLGISVGTVRTHVKRGLARMRSDLTETSLGADDR